MNPRLFSRLLPKRGSALVIVLAFVVLVTVLVLAFFSRSILERQMSNASANQTKVDILAHSAIDTIVGDFKQEIVAGSTSTNVGPTTNLTTLYFPISPTNMIPARSGNPSFTGGALNDPIPNLIRRSVRSDPLVAGGQIGVSASAVNSATDPSANGRSVSLARWNSHYLIPRQNAGSAAIDTTPTNSFVAPDWVMVTANGPATVTTPSTNVIGRYAYAIYDEGGLLDANVAGFPSGLTNYPNSGSNVVSTKGSAALADLAAIGITNADNLVGWRNYGTIKPPPPNSMGNYNFQGDAASSSNYYQYITNATNGGFVTVSTNSFNGQTDQMFTSRQALLKFRRATGISQDALQYLGTFSRDLEQPSFQPDPNRPKNLTKQWRNPVPGSSGGTPDGYGGNDAYQQQDTFNPSLLTVRDSSNQPVMRRRFPLSRLALVVPNPTPQSVAEIKKYFGLVWDSSLCRWIYTSPDGNGSAASVIKTLDQVATANREPDFFETLKAVINCDSLAKQHGGNESFQGAGQSPHSFLSNGKAVDGRVDYQVMQIGANLIDQYDADSYPTRIQFDQSSSPIYQQEFYGVENVPYLLGWMTSWYRLRQLASTDIQPDSPGLTYQPPNGVMPYENNVLIQPILWNPHAPDSRPNPPAVPTDFQIQAGSPDTNLAGVSIFPQVQAGWWTGVPVTTSGTSTIVKFTHNYPSITGTPLTPDSYAMATIGPISDSTPTSYIRFTVTNNTLLEPYRLHAPDDPAGIQGTTASAIISSSDLEEGTFSQALGFNAGKCWTGPGTQSSPQDTGGNLCLVEGTLNTALRFHLQYKNPYQATPAYLTYDVIFSAYLSSSSQFSTVADVLSSGAPNSIRGMRTGFRADPRTDRWGLGTVNTCPFWNSFAKWNGVGTKPSWMGSYPNSPVFYYPQGLTVAAGAGLPFINVTGISNWQWACAPGWKPTGLLQYTGDVELNNRIPDNSTSANAPGNKCYYTDVDGVLRRASGAYSNSTDGLPLVTNNITSRPIILNRPFRSVAEMGYAFRGVAWKDIDFFTPESGDTALLDAFCLNELSNAPSDVAVAGRVNLNTRQPKVLEALIRGAAKAEGVAGTLSNDEAAKASQLLVAWTGDTTSNIAGVPSKGPLRNRAELVGKWVSAQTFTITGARNLPLQTFIDGSQSYSGFSSMLTSGVNGVFANASDAAIKRRRESVLRALVDSGNTRTWNLLIDVIAQTGRYSPTASSMNSFTVEGETRFWVHVAIDRITGQVLAKQVEAVSE